VILQVITHGSIRNLLHSPDINSPFSDLDTPSIAHPTVHLDTIRLMLDFDTCNAARLRRDPSFDGKFFTAVMTTKIYCRPVCPAKHSLTKNVCYYPTAAAAERAGYRPCLRCRPETAPFCPAWNGTKTTVERALGLIDKGALDTGSVDDLADRLGVSSRHLSRLFAKHIGASPIQTAQTHRIGRAKKLLDTTTLSITDIAFQAGFGSVRSFNTAFVKLYGRTPSSVRILQKSR